MNSGELLAIYFGSAVVGLCIQYLIIRWAVKHGTRDALQETNALLRANVRVVAAPTKATRAAASRTVGQPLEDSEDVGDPVDDLDALEAATQAAMRADRS